ncbi:uncharacterized protein F5891DRAFT_1195295 [Suillus fuscotomentosus]|uniref:MYND-type domain-containing protein n=1 Tax=Suillus fuscotomentosus TaxID=1912939 RepID=A0AAD4DV04_9AGAM|nr:uncharacterized protein F5891DRAFT_1195295 [Suillus fuscotomentosus]KAG1894455.1 hypothetical protein F5891DRAFT_1195295 [Suillus fuscotomentosus]
MALAIKDDDAVKTPKYFPPLLSKKFNITDVKQDALKWDKEWEAAIASSTAADVLKEMSCFLDDSGFTPDAMEFFHQDLRRVQDNVAKILHDLFDKGHFDTIWLLLNVTEKKRHINEGLKGACEARTLWGQDCRALCLEVTVSNLLMQGGKGFVDFLARILESSESSLQPAFLPNSWWEQASNLPNPWWEQTPATDVPPRGQVSQSTKLLFEVATINRNKFISKLFSVISDITNRSEGMKGVLHFMENTKGYVARAVAQAKMTFRDKPLVCCENCTKTPEEIGQGVRFMVYSVCKAKLNFEIHYCSQSCQKQDWSLHKRACGKKSVSKGLSGTKGDSLWAFSNSNPTAEMLRNFDKEGRQLTSLRDIGVNPCKGKRTPAAEHQAEMLEADRNVDYFLFTASGEAVRFVIDDPGAKMIFQINCGWVMTQVTSDTGVEAMGEYILKVMSRYPRLSRSIILKQLCEEHRAGTTEKIMWLEKKSREHGDSTFIESWVKDSSPLFGGWSWLGLL